LEKAIIELESKGAPNKNADKTLKELNEKLLAKEKSIENSINNIYLLYIKIDLIKI